MTKRPKTQTIKRLPAPASKCLRAGAIVEYRWFTIELFKDGRWDDFDHAGMKEDDLKDVRRAAKGVEFAMEKVRIMEHFSGKQPTGIEYDDR